MYNGTRAHNTPNETRGNKMKVQITLYREKTFTRKYGAAVKAVGGSYTHCRGNEWDREVTIPCYGNEKLIQSICSDLSLFRNERWAQAFVFFFTVGEKVYRRSIDGKTYADALNLQRHLKSYKKKTLLFKYRLPKSRLPKSRLPKTKQGETRCLQTTSTTRRS